ncbi:MAG: GNAT family N-acetyltransferase [Clostridia bacterium]|nr:GNAT family N-acetyltransferase [Clostridia bacterium]
MTMHLTGDFEIAPASYDDLEELSALEALGFPGDEAASKAAFAYRLQSFPDWFLAARSDGRIIGLINGVLSHKKLITDDVYLPDSQTDDSGTNLLLLGLVVHPDYRRKGIAEKLMKTILQNAKNKGITYAALTCRDRLIPYYEKFGFTNQGVSKSVIGNVIWNDMVIEL